MPSYSVSCGRSFHQNEHKARPRFPSACMKYLPHARLPGDNFIVGILVVAREFPEPHLGSLLLSLLRSLGVCPGAQDGSMMSFLKAVSSS